MALAKQAVFDITESAQQAHGKRAVHILVVDDDPMVLQVLAAGLRQTGYDVSAVDNPLDALALLRGSPYDLLLTDAYMPQMDGLMLAETVSSVFPGLPVVLLTGLGTTDLMREALRRGAGDFITKPFRVRDIPIVIERNMERKRLEIERLAGQSSKILFQAITALLTAVDAKEHHTAQHSRRVASISASMGREMRLSEQELRVLELGAWMHDVGKIGTPDAILCKPGALTPDEWQVMKEHAAKGGEIVAQIEDLRHLASIIRHHHERPDGLGYPDALQGDAIPLPSRIITVADAYETMTSDRRYRSRLPVEAALRELDSQAGSQFDSTATKVLLKLVDEGAVSCHSCARSP